MRAGEAKLRGCVRDMPPQRCASGWGERLLLAGSFFKVFAAMRVGFKCFCKYVFASRGFFADRRMGFKCLSLFLPTGTWVLIVFTVFADRYMGFKRCRCFC